MENKVIWASNALQEKICNLDEDAKRNYLIENLGYDSEMLVEADLNKVIYDDHRLSKKDEEEFDNDILPMINNQTKDGIVLLIGDSVEPSIKPCEGTGGDAADAFELQNYGTDDSPIKLYDDGNGLVLEVGDETAELYAVPEAGEDLGEFILECAPGLVDYYKEIDDLDDEDALVAACENLSQQDLVIYTNFSKVPEYCYRIKNTITESVVDESVSTKNPKEVAKEYKELKKLSDEYGYEYFTAMPFINDKDIDGDDDRSSIEYQYPEFAKVVKAFILEMGDGTKEDINNPEFMEDYWYFEPGATDKNGDPIDRHIDQHDWDVMMETMDHYLSKGKSVQFEKIYKNGFDDGLKSDKEMIADREKEQQAQDDLMGDEEDESLEEGRKTPYDSQFDKDVDDALDAGALDCGDEFADIGDEDEFFEELTEDGNPAQDLDYKLDIGYDVECEDDMGNWESLNPPEPGTHGGQIMFDNKEDAIAYAEKTPEATRVEKVGYETDGPGQHVMWDDIETVWSKNVEEGVSQADLLDPDLTPDSTPEEVEKAAREIYDSGDLVARKHKDINDYIAHLKKIYGIKTEGLNNIDTDIAKGVKKVVDDTLAKDGVSINGNDIVIEDGLDEDTITRLTHKHKNESVETNEADEANKDTGKWDKTGRIITTGDGEVLNTADRPAVSFL